jgi:hypothetical protein
VKKREPVNAYDIAAIIIVSAVAVSYPLLSAAFLTWCRH